MKLAYKGFNKGAICRGFQFLPGKNVTEEANCVKNGFHCAENPLDCLSYYPDFFNSEYWIVEVSGDTDEDGYDTKISATEMVLKKKLSPLDFMLHCLRYAALYPDVSHSRIYDGIADVTDFAVVRGENPIGKGKKGSVIGFLKTAPDGSAVEWNFFQIDGETYIPDVYYDLNGMEVTTDECLPGKLRIVR